MKRALVLGGGGSKGAYQIGSYEALCELGISFDSVIGVSIGSLNGAIIAQGDFSRAKELWQKISVEKVLANGLNLTKNIDYYFENTQKIIPFLKTYAQNKGMDTTPLQRILESYLNWDKLQKSKLDFGLVCLEVPSFAPCEKTKKQITKPYLSKWILASCSCFPAFPVYEIDGKKYIDGGYYDNLPIDLAFKMGADEVIAISLNPEFITKYDTSPIVKHIRPCTYLGTMLDFTQESIQRNMRLGYLDMMRAFGKFYGHCYTFEPLDSSFIRHWEQKIRALLGLVLRQELDERFAPISFTSKLNTQISNTGILSKVSSTTPFSDKLLELANPKKAPKIAPIDILLLFVEEYMRTFQYDNLKIWNLESILNEAQEALITNANSPICADIRSYKNQILDFKPDSMLLEESTKNIALIALLQIILENRNM